ncbi:MAG: hypothetical protein WCF65_03245 [Parachlamydiaceae bacterium]
MSSIQPGSGQDGLGSAAGAGGKHPVEHPNLPHENPELVHVAQAALNFHNAPEVLAARLQPATGLVAVVRETKEELQVKKMILLLTDYKERPQNLSDGMRESIKKTLAPGGLDALNEQPHLVEAINNFLKDNPSVRQQNNRS